MPNKISTLGNKVIGKFYFLPLVIYDILSSNNEHVLLYNILKNYVARSSAKIGNSKLLSHIYRVVGLWITFIHICNSVTHFVIEYFIILQKAQIIVKINEKQKYQVKIQNH